MGRTSQLLGILSLFICSVSAASVFQPISEAHRSAALELFSPSDGSFGSLEETYEALRTFEVLGIDKKSDVSVAACRAISDAFGSTSSSPKDVFYALKVNGVLKCQMKDGFFEGAISRLQGAASSASSLLDLYHAIGSLVLIKDQTSKVDLHLADADGVFRSIKALSQSDGRWRYSSNNPESSTFAAGLALESLSGVISLSSSEIDQSLVSSTKSDILKLFDSIEKYDDGTFYFDEKLVDASDHQGALSTTSSVLRGISAFAAVTSANLNIPKEKILGLAKFFLSIGIPGDAKDLFSQVDSLAYLENNRVSIPLIVSLPATVVSLTKADNLKVKVNTVLGSNAPPLTVKLARVFSSGSKDASVTENQELKYDSEKSVHVLEDLPRGLDVGSYTFVFEVFLHDPEHKKIYATGGQTKVLVFLTGVIKLEKAEVAVLDSDLGSIEARKNFETTVSLSANHLQKLQLSFELTTPLGDTFQPHQAIVKLRHETKVEHIFVIGSSGKKFEIVLDFLGLVEKFYYLSGKYDIQLCIGDAAMENSFVKDVGYIDLDLPEPSEKAPRPPAQPVDPYTKYGPKAEITHIFRSPEKLPPKELSLAFLGLTLLPFFGFLIGLLRLGVNLKNFPSSATSATFALLFHSGIAAVLLLYVLFWTKLDLFTTLKALGFLGIFLMFVGNRTLSHLSSTSSKIKSQ